MNEVSNRIESFFAPYGSKNTIKLYKSVLKNYFSTFYPNESLESGVEKYFSAPKTDDDFEHDVTNFFVKIKDRPPISIGVSMSAIKMFLMENDIELSDKFWRNLKRKVQGSGAISEDRIPTPDELKRIMSQMPINGRAFFLVLVSSGMRGGEVLQLKIKDVDLTKDPVRIRVRAANSKNGNKHLTFITSEAKTYLEEWLKIREAHLKRYKKLDDGFAYPFHGN